MRLRLFTYAALVAAFVGGTALVADALTVTDEEQLEGLVDALVESPEDALGEWTDPSLVPVDAQVDGRHASVSAALARLGGEDVEVVQRSVDLRGDRASVAVRVRVDGELADASFRLERHEDRWLIRHVTAR
ncbi:MAG: hypothetical protein R3B82_19510 [Sandaracinaceae bacterium]